MGETCAPVDPFGCLDATGWANQYIQSVMKVLLRTSLGLRRLARRGGDASVGPMHCDVPPTHERSDGGVTRSLQMFVVLKGFHLVYVPRCVDQVTLIHPPGSLLRLCMCPVGGAGACLRVGGLCSVKWPAALRSSCGMVYTLPSSFHTFEILGATLSFILHHVDAARCADGTAHASIFSLEGRRWALKITRWQLNLESVGVALVEVGRPLPRRATTVMVVGR